MERSDSTAPGSAKLIYTLEKLFSWTTHDCNNWALLTNHHSIITWSPRFELSHGFRQVTESTRQLSYSSYMYASCTYSSRSSCGRIPPGYNLRNEISCISGRIHYTSRRDNTTVIDKPLVHSHCPSFEARLIFLIRNSVHFFITFQAILLSFKIFQTEPN